MSYTNYRIQGEVGPDSVVLIPDSADEAEVSLILLGLKLVDVLDTVTVFMTRDLVIVSDFKVGKHLLTLERVK